MIVYVCVLHLVSLLFELEVIGLNHVVLYELVASYLPRKIFAQIRVIWNLCITDLNPANNFVNHAPFHELKEKLISGQPSNISA